MKPLRVFVILLLTVFSTPLAAADGLVTVKSPRSAKDTMNRLEEIVKQRGLNVVARIDHAAGTATVGKAMRPTEVWTVANPQGGTPLMECAEAAGIGLPLKALVWEDSSSQVSPSYTDAGYIAQRHGAAQCAVVENLSKALAGIAAA